MKKIIISWLLVILWAGFIFYNSAMNANKSSSESKTVVKVVVKKTVNVTNKLGITNKNLTKSNIKQIVDKLHNPVRKLAHIFEYFIFTILLCIALYNTNIKDKKLFVFAILICFLYAITDELHQLFVNGRSGEIKDIFIDTFGGLIATLIYYIFYKKHNTRI